MMMYKREERYAGRFSGGCAKKHDERHEKSHAWQEERREGVGVIRGTGITRRVRWAIFALIMIGIFNLCSCQPEAYAESASETPAEEQTETNAEEERNVSLGITLRDGADDDNLAEGEGPQTVIVSVAAVNLEPGVEYEYNIGLIYADSGKPVYSDGKEIQEIVKFIPQFMTELHEFKLFFDGLSNRGKSIAAEVTISRRGQSVGHAQSTDFTGGILQVSSGSDQNPQTAASGGNPTQSSAAIGSDAVATATESESDLQPIASKGESDSQAIASGGVPDHQTADLSIDYSADAPNSTALNNARHRRTTILISICISILSFFAGTLIGRRRKNEE